MKYELKFIKDLRESLEKYPDFINVILGPRQVGKTTGALCLQQEYLGSDSHYESAEGSTSLSNSWVREQWLLFKSKYKSGVLILDEIQNVENWSQEVKALWDMQKREGTSDKIKLILLGSSSLKIQKGLQESLAGRFRLFQVPHWSFKDTQKITQDLDLEQYLIYGGYPGSYQFIHNKKDFKNYILNSIIDPVIGKDILSLNRVKSPALFRQSFDLFCSYASKEISLTKLLGQLQNKGNTDLVKYYLELFEGSYLIKSLQKYSENKLKLRQSSPKIITLAPVLFSLTNSLNINSEILGRSFESVVGSELLKVSDNLSYWRDKNLEVDFVAEVDGKVFAIEVKSKMKTNTAQGLVAFTKKYPKSEGLIVDQSNWESVLGQLSDLS